MVRFSDVSRPENCVEPLFIFRSFVLRSFNWLNITQLSLYIALNSEVVPNVNYSLLRGHVMASTSLDALADSKPFSHRLLEKYDIITNICNKSVFRNALKY